MGLGLGVGLGLSLGLGLGFDGRAGLLLLVQQLDRLEVEAWLGLVLGVRG